MVFVQKPLSEEAKEFVMQHGGQAVSRVIVADNCSFVDCENGRVAEVLRTVLINVGYAARVQDRRQPTSRKFGDVHARDDSADEGPTVVKAATSKSCAGVVCAVGGREQKAPNIWKILGKRAAQQQEADDSLGCEDIWWPEEDVFPQPIVHYHYHQGNGWHASEQQSGDIWYDHAQWSQAHGEFGGDDDWPGEGDDPTWQCC